MQNQEKAPRKRMFSEEQKAELFNGREPTGGDSLSDSTLGSIPLAMKYKTQKNEEEILIRVQFKANLETQYLLNCLCKHRKKSRDTFMAELIRQESKKENIGILIES